MFKISPENKAICIMLFGLISLVQLACNAVNETKSIEYFSAKIDGVLWQALPSQSMPKYIVSYKPLSHQLSIIAEGNDGSKLELSFHAINELKIGKYPSILSDEGVQSGIFYFPNKKNGQEMASVTYNLPVQENTVNLTKLDKTDPKVYLIEGTFSAKLYALYQNNPKQTSNLVEGKFSVSYRPDAYNPEF